MSEMLNNKDLISIEDLNKTYIVDILGLATKCKRSEIAKNLFENYIMAVCFFEPSTRTRLSFESAMLRLGGKVLGFSDGAVSSSAKGETLHDTVKSLSGLCDIIVIRHYLSGAPGIVAKSVNIPVINAGDGSNKHPSQTLLDLFSIQETQGKIEGLSICIVGDLKFGRAVHSLIDALCIFKNRLYLVSSTALTLPKEYEEKLRIHKILFSYHDSVEDVIEELDIIYATRVQRERCSESLGCENLHKGSIISMRLLKNAKSNLKVLHPLPRINEIEIEVDTSKFAYYFEHVSNGVFVRQAILAKMLGVIT